MTAVEGWEILPMRRRDMRQVMAIEERVFPEPWSQVIFGSELAAKNRAYRVARIGRTVIGYVGMMFIDDEAHVTTLAATSTHSRRGVGTSLLLDVIEGALERGASAFSLEVAASNDQAQALYHRFGFVPVGVRKNYYQKTGEDAFVMWVHNANVEAYSDRLEGIRTGLRSRM